MNATIRPYEAARDFEGMLSLTRTVAGRMTIDEARRLLSRYPEPHLSAMVAVGADEEILGYCAATYPYWWKVAMIDYLVVAPAARRQGIGGGLVRAVESRLREVGLRRVCVQTVAWNESGISFYQALGYDRRAMLPDYYGEQNDLVWLDKSLDGKGG